MLRPLLIVTAFGLTVPLQAEEPTRTLVMTQVTVRDPMVNNMVAGTLLKPEGWTMTGGVKWYPNAYHQANFEAKISNPQSREQLEFLPIGSCIHIKNPVMPMQRLSNYQGSLVLEPMSPGKIVEEFTLPHFRKVKPRSVRQFDMPELAKLCEAAAGGGRWKATRIRVTYDEAGVMMEEDFYVSCYYFPEASLGVNNATSTIWGIGAAFAIRAERGKLDQATPTMLAVVHSLKGNPEHLRQVIYVRGLFCKRVYTEIESAREISNTISANNDRAISLMREARASRAASEDRISRNFSDYIRGTQEYSHNGTSYSLPNHYQQAWVNTNGTILLSNSAGFDPNTTHSGTWNELKRIP